MGSVEDSADEGAVLDSVVDVADVVDSEVVETELL